MLVEWGMGSNTNSGPSFLLVTPADSAGLPNGGITWQTPISLPNGADTGTLDVDTNGNLFIGGGGSPFWCLRSSNAQDGNQTPTFEVITQVNLGGDLIQAA
jgi:hypothetical protein